MKKSRSVGVIILVAILLLVVTILDTWSVFEMTSDQTRDSGSYRLESIGGELENTISDAEKRTMELTLQVYSRLGDRTALRRFVFEHKDTMKTEDNGAFNIYLAGTGWDIIPGFVRTEDYVATERNWYTGAVKKKGATYVTAPYVDVVTGNVCYTVSQMLPDHDTVLGIDYTIDTIQKHIKGLFEDEACTAVIATEDGTIAGCSEEDKISKQLVDSYPEYAGIFSLAKKSDDVVTTRIQGGGAKETVFAVKAGNGWYVIVSEEDWNLYKDSYIQLIVTIVLSVALFVIILLLFINAQRSRKRTEEALVSRNRFLESIGGEFQEPLHRILERSSREHVEKATDYEEDFASIHVDGGKLSEMIRQILSYNSLISKEEEKKKKKQKLATSRVNRRFRTMIVVFMSLVLVFSMYSNIRATYSWGTVQMQREVEHYEHQLSSWISTQKSILDMFCSEISTQPDMLKSYHTTISYLDGITKQYPEISVTYICNPDWNPSVYMNNGWTPGVEWDVEERPWYIMTEKSESGWSISEPYFDAQTGMYCVTFSERVYNDKTGDFIGIFGIDFYMDKLVEILGDSYSDDGYAFLVDAQGDIINHPNGNYQMSKEKTTNVSDSMYGDLKPDGESTKIIRDYDGAERNLIAVRNSDSNFSVYVVNNTWDIYGRVVLYGGISFIVFLLSIIIVYRWLTSMIRWQEEVNEKLKGSADAAIAAGTAKSEFLAQMSHEIRTPINAVLGMNEMILRESDDDRILDYADNIQTAGRTLLTIINGILDFSKIEDGKLEIMPVKYELANLVNSLILSIDERARAKSLVLETEVEERLPSVMYGDDVRISQVIMNLLTNAVKYTERGKVMLSIRDGGRDGNSIWLNVSVKDTGIGIREEDREKLFESFERLDEERNRNIEGTGLGMAIVTKLLQMMDSSLEVESVYGQGSTFSFRLRQQIVDGTPIGNYLDHIEKERDKAGEETYLYSPQARVLIVDDNSINLKVAVSLIKLYGIVPDTASSGEEAIGMVEEKSYDIIFLDHMMPKMDGIETLAKMKEKKILPPHIVVVALTANAVNGAKERYLDAGFDDYLAKPIEVAALEKMLREHLPEEIIEERVGKPKRHSGTEAKSTSGGEAPVGVDAAGKADTADEEGNAAESSDEGNISFRGDPLEYLKSKGVKIEQGLAYSGEDRDFYVEMLSDYAESREERSRELEELLEKKDLAGYQICVHSLKSVSKMIGADAIAEKAYALEKASGDGDEEFIRENHADLLESFDKLATMITYVTKE